MRRRLVIWLTVMLTGASLFAQEHKICHDWNTAQPLAIRDSLVIIPATIDLPIENYTLSMDADGRGFQIEVKQTVKEERIRLCYQTIGFQLSSQKQGLEPARYDSSALFKNTYQEESKSNQAIDAWVPTDKIEKSGNISRAMSFGNRQSAMLNSAMNLQLSGMITDEIELSAQIADSQVPYQAEGNTQHIQEFDRILIGLRHNKWQLQAGDVLLQSGNSHFLNYRKNVQGANFRFEQEVGTARLSGRVGASLAKGKFASIQLEALEGVSGPYRLKGASGERFIMVLANSESVFLDGKLLERGFDRDYIIDYNTAEITFSNRVMITKYSRIRVDFEYADQNYSRSNLQASQQVEIDRLKLYVDFYQEKDNAFRPLFFQLTDADMQKLSELPSGTRMGQISGVDSTGFLEDRVMYKKIDTLMADGRQYRDIFIHSHQAEEAAYRLVFTNVGEGNGNYVLSSELSNGRVFEWVAPVNGHLMGNYEPIRQIPLPNKRNMLVSGAEIKLNHHEKLAMELALSNQDENLFSEDNELNNGQALMLQYSSEGRAFLSEQWQWYSGLSYEYTSQTFQGIDRFRPIEFDRDWGYRIADSLGAAADHISTISIGINNSKTKDFIEYQLSNRHRDEYINGWQQKSQLLLTQGNWTLSANGFLLASNQNQFENEWYRAFASLKRNGKYVVPSYRFEIDHNLLIMQESKELHHSDQYFHAHSFALNSNDSLSWQWGMDFQIREDAQPVNGEMQLADASKTFQFNVISPYLAGQRVSTQFILRNNQNFQVADSVFQENSISGSLAWDGNFLKRSISLNALYSVANSRELDRSFYFRQVGRGIGTHSWKDLNGNGQQELNEFFIDSSPYGDRDYIKIFLPTDEYILAFSTMLQVKMHINAPTTWYKSTGLKKTLSKFSISSVYTANNKTRNAQLGQKLNPIVADPLDHDLLSLRENFRTSLFFNRSSTAFGWEGTIARRRLKQYLYSGFDFHELSETVQNLRWQMFDFYHFNISYKIGEKTLWSDFQMDRNFAYRFQELSPQLSWQKGSHLRLSFRYSFINRDVIENESFDDVFSKLHDGQLEMRWMQASQWNLQASGGLVNVQFKGEEQSAYGFELLQALRPGNNMVWNVQIQKHLFADLQLGLQYFGRYAKHSPLFQSGNVQLSAIF